MSGLLVSGAVRRPGVRLVQGPVPGHCGQPGAGLLLLPAGPGTARPGTAGLRRAARRGVAGPRTDVDLAVLAAEPGDGPLAAVVVAVQQVDVPLAAALDDLAGHVVAGVGQIPDRPLPEPGVVDRDVQVPGLQGELVQ